MHDFTMIRHTAEAGIENGSMQKIIANKIRNYYKKKLGNVIPTKN